MSDVFTTRVRRVVSGAGIASVVATLVVLFWGADLAGPDVTLRDSYSSSALGHAGLLELLARLGFHVHRVRHARYDHVAIPLAFLEPYGARGAIEGHRVDLSRALDQRSAKSLTSVVVLPKWLGRVQSDGLVAVPDGDARAVLGAAFPSHTPALHHRPSISLERLAASGSLGAFQIEVPAAQTIDVPAGAEVLLALDTGRALIVRSGAIVLIAEPDLINNHGFHRADHALVVDALLRRVLRTDTLGVDEVFHGHGENLSMTKALVRFPLLLATLHALALAVLFVVAGGRRFGPPKPSPAGVGRGPREAIAVAGSVLAAGQPLAKLAAGYVETSLFDMHARLGLAATSPSLEERARAIDEAAKRRGVPAAAVSLLTDARSLAAMGRKASKTECWRIARTTFAFRERTLRSASIPSATERARP